MSTGEEEEPQSLVELRRELQALQRSGAAGPSDGADDQDAADRNGTSGVGELSELDRLARALMDLRGAGGRTDRQSLWERIEPRLQEEPPAGGHH